MTIQKTLATTAILALATAGPVLAQDSGNPEIDGTAMDPQATIWENLQASPRHGKLVAAVEEAGLSETLESPGPFTLFAPSDDAFEALESMPDAEQLETILSCHLLNLNAMSETLNEMILGGDDGEAPVPTLGGCTLTASVAEDGTFILTDQTGGTADVTLPDIRNYNGTIHVIDGILMPES